MNPPNLLSTPVRWCLNRRFRGNPKIELAMLGGRKTVFGIFVAGRRLPLTPALSLGERGKAGPPLHDNRAAAFATRRTTIHPLPKGEGRGEGEGDGRSFRPCESGWAPRPIFTPHNVPPGTGFLSVFGFRISDFLSACILLLSCVHVWSADPYAQARQYKHGQPADPLAAIQSEIRSANPEQLRDRKSVV